MKKIYLSILSALAGFSLHAQLTQANQAPTAGYTYQLYQCDSTAINPGASGANATWNFSTIVTHSNVLSNYIEATSANPSYPSASVTVGSNANNTSYYSSTATELDYFGGNVTVGPVNASLIYTSPAVVASYPMSLNTATTSAIAGTINVTSPPISGTFTGTCHVVADGAGTLMLPGGASSTFTNTIRVVTTQSMNANAGFATATVTQMTYDYYAVGIRNPVFSISSATTVISAFGSPSTNTQVIVTRDKNASVSTTTTTTTTVSVGEIAPNTVNLNVYPNPSSSYVQFVTDSPDAKLVNVYDITGKFVDKLIITEGKVKMDVSELNTGLYFYTVTGSGNRALKTGRITVNH